MREKRVAVSSYFCCLNESPSEKEGKFDTPRLAGAGRSRLNESPSEKEGKCFAELLAKYGPRLASMKVPPKRKGNAGEKGSCELLFLLPQ